MFAGHSGISFDNGIYGNESKHSLDVSSCENHHFVSSAVNVETKSGGHLSQVPMIYIGTNSEVAAKDNDTSQMTASLASVMQTSNMTAFQCTSLSQCCVFSTELANCAAESVRVGRYDSIIDFHQDYCRIPLSQVFHY